jgi:hypothetical protein
MHLLQTAAGRRAVIKLFTSWARDIGRSYRQLYPQGHAQNQTETLPSVGSTLATVDVGERLAVCVLHDIAAGDEFDLPRRRQTPLHRASTATTSAMATSKLATATQKSAQPKGYGFLPLRLAALSTSAQSSRLNFRFSRSCSSRSSLFEVIPASQSVVRCRSGAHRIAKGRPPKRATPRTSFQATSGSPAPCA